MRVRFSPRAVRDLNGIAEYISLENPAAAMRVRNAILKSIEVVAAFPSAGRLQSVSKVRKLITRPYNYVVYYAVETDRAEVRIVTIQHPARNPEYRNR
jgi:toxin ParE1/3/4